MDIGTAEYIVVYLNRDTGKRSESRLIFTDVYDAIKHAQNNTDAISRTEVCEVTRRTVWRSM